MTSPRLPCRQLEEEKGTACRSLKVEKNTEPKLAGKVELRQSGVIDNTSQPKEAGYDVAVGYSADGIRHD